MSTERVTISLPAELRQAVQQAADDGATSFSAIVSEALTAWTRGRIIDELLAEYQREHGPFTEEELRQAAEEAGVPYVEPRRPASAA